MCSSRFLEHNIDSSDGWDSEESSDSEASGSDRDVVDQGVVAISENDNATREDFEINVTEQWLGPVIFWPDLLEEAEDIDAAIDLCLNRVSMPSEICDGIYIGNFDTARAYLRGEDLPSNFPGITHVLSVIDFKRRQSSDRIRAGIYPRDRARFPKSHLKRINMKDTVQINYLEWFPEICKFIHGVMQKRKARIEELRENGHEPNDNELPNLLVHCRKGISRSATAVIAYLLWAWHKDPVETFNFVQTKRFIVWPNKEFFYQLNVWYFCKCNLILDGKLHPQYSDFLFNRDKILLPADPTRPNKGKREMALEGVERPPKPL